MENLGKNLEQWKKNLGKSLTLVDMTLVELTQSLEKMIEASRFLPFNFKFTVGQVNKFL